MRWSLIFIWFIKFCLMIECQKFIFGDSVLASLLIGNSGFKKFNIFPLFWNEITVLVQQRHLPFLVMSLRSVGFWRMFGILFQQSENWWWPLLVEEGLVQSFNDYCLTKKATFQPLALKFEIWNEISQGKDSKVSKVQTFFISFGNKQIFVFVFLWVCGVVLDFNLFFVVTEFFFIDVFFLSRKKKWFNFFSIRVLEGSRFSLELFWRVKFWECIMLFFWTCFFWVLMSFAFIGSKMMMVAFVVWFLLWKKYYKWRKEKIYEKVQNSNIHFRVSIMYQRFLQTQLLLLLWAVCFCLDCINIKSEWIGL